MSAEGCVCNRSCLLGDDELLRWHILDDDFALLGDLFDLNIVGKQGLHDGFQLDALLLRHHQVFGGRGNRSLAYLKLLLLHNLVLLVSQKNREFFFSQVLVGLGVDFLFLVPVDLHNPVLLKQSVLEPCVHDRHTRVVPIEHPVTVVSCLLSLFLVARAIRLKSHCLVGLSKDSQESRQRTVNGLCNLSRDDLGATLYFITVALTVVVLKGFATSLSGLRLDIPKRIINL